MKRRYLVTSRPLEPVERVAFFQQGRLPASGVLHVFSARTEGALTKELHCYLDTKGFSYSYARVVGEPMLTGKRATALIFDADN